MIPSNKPGASHTPVSSAYLFHSSSWIPLRKSAMSWCLSWMMKAKRKHSSYWLSHLHTSYSFFSLRSKLNLKSNSGHFSALKRNYTSLTVDSPAHCTPHFKGNLCWLCHNLSVLANLRWFTSLCFDFQEQRRINTMISTLFPAKPSYLRTDESLKCLNSKCEVVCSDLCEERWGFTFTVTFIIMHLFIL